MYIVPTTLRIFFRKGSEYVSECASSRFMTKVWGHETSIRAFLRPVCWLSLIFGVLKRSHFFDISKKERTAIFVHKRRKSCSCLSSPKTRFWIVARRLQGVVHTVQYSWPFILYTGFPPAILRNYAHSVHSVHILDRCPQFLGYLRTLTYMDQTLTCWSVPLQQKIAAVRDTILDRCPQIHLGRDTVHFLNNLTSS